MSAFCTAHSENSIVIRYLTTERHTNQRERFMNDRISNKYSERFKNKGKSCRTGNCKLKLGKPSIHSGRQSRPQFGNYEKSVSGGCEKFRCYRYSHLIPETSQFRQFSAPETVLQQRRRIIMSKKERNAIYLHPETKELIESHIKQTIGYTCSLFLFSYSFSLLAGSVYQPIILL